jgi:hypothetical protein
MQLGYAFRGARVLMSAVELDVFTMLAAAPRDGETLRQCLGLHKRGARDFFDALVALGMLERSGDVYCNTPETDFYLDRNKPSYIGGILHLADTRLYPVWGKLTTALRTGRPQEWQADDDMFDAMSSDQAGLLEFAQAMTGLSLPVAQALAARFPWRDYASFIDIGTAEGAACVEIARAHRHLSGGGFDLPQLETAFDAYVRRHKLSERLRFYGGDFLEQELPSADVLVMGQILHDWNLAVKRDLLAKAYAALPKGGALVVYDQMIDDERRHNAPGLLMSLSMLLRTQGGLDYTGADCIDWMREAGFTGVRCERLTGPYSMVAGIKWPGAAARLR